MFICAYLSVKIVLFRYDTEIVTPLSIMYDELPPPSDGTPPRRMSNK